MSMKPVITTDELLSVEQVQASRNTPFNDANPSNIPDLHTSSEGETPTVAQMRDINNTINKTQVLNKEDIIQQKITEDLKKATSSFSLQGNSPLSVLKQMISLGEYKEDIKLYGQLWTIRALDQSDLMLAVEEATSLTESPVGKLTAIAFYQLVYSIEAVNGVSIYEMFKDTIKVTDYPSQIAYIIAVKKALKRYLEHFPPAVIDSLYYEGYVKVDEKRNKALEELKNS